MSTCSEIPVTGLGRYGRWVTNDLSNREAQYGTAMPDGPEIVHCRHTTNSKLVETLVMHVIDDYRYEPMHEWFQGDPEYFASLIDMAVDFVDGLIEIGEKATPFQLKDKLSKLLKRAKRFDPEDEGDDSDESSCSAGSITNVIVSGTGHTVTVNSPEALFKQDVKDFVSEKLIKSQHPEDVLNWIDLFAEYKKSKSCRVTREDLRRELAIHGIIYKDSSVNGKKFYGFLGWRLK